MKYKTQRDEFIWQLMLLARQDKDIVLLSADMGAPALDDWRKELPGQFIPTGIAEQNTINLAAGLSAGGKKVFVYMMACWMARCYEQIRYSCAAAGNPITIIANAVGLGYAPSGPAHNPTEDIAYMRALNGIEIYSPSDLESVIPMVHMAVNKPALRVFRLERTVAGGLEGFPKMDSQTLSYGLRGVYDPKQDRDNPSVAILSSGYMLGRAKAAARLIASEYSSWVFDVFRIKPMSLFAIRTAFNGIKRIVTIEEQTLAGGFGSAIMEAMSDADIGRPLLRIGLPERYIFENGTRDELLDANGLSAEKIAKRIKSHF